MTDQSALYIVATPIGNLSDMTTRAIDVLKNVDMIAAEDTRHSSKLLDYFNINTPKCSYHDNGSQAQIERIINLLKEGKSVALISDAGTPLISDPGYKLVSHVREQGVKVIPIPGACALVAALSASSMPSDKFLFSGFPPAKTSARKKLFDELKRTESTLIFYESPHRVEDSLKDMAEVFGGDREIVLARELTKTYETFISCSLAKMLSGIENEEFPLKGEIVIIVAGFIPDESSETVSQEAEKLMRALLQELPLKKAASISAKYFGIKRGVLYDWGLAQKEN